MRHIPMLGRQSLGLALAVAAGGSALLAQIMPSPVISVAREGPLLRLTARDLAAGRAYRLQSSSAIDSDAWENVGMSTFATNDPITFEVPLDAATSARFFRVAEVAKGWVLVNTNGPSGGGIAAYDTDRNVVVMFACVGSYPSDTWEFDGTSWRQVSVSGPRGRDTSGKMVYDPVRKRMVMQGGWWPDNNDPWTWEYQVTGDGPDDRKWVQLTQADCAYRGGICLALDTRRNQALHFGGGHWQSFHNDYWRFDCATDQWIRLGTWGPARFAAGLVYDSRRDRFVLFGGTGRWWSGDTEQGRGNTCEFDPATASWAEIVPQGAAGAPGPRWFPTMVYDPVEGVTLMIGGGRNSDGHSYRDQWEWDGSRWTEVPLRSDEPAGGAIWFDTRRGRPMLFSAPNTWVYHR